MKPLRILPVSAINCVLFALGWALSEEVQPSMTSHAQQSDISNSIAGRTADVLTDIYILTPTLNGYAFSPSTRTVSVAPDATGQDSDAIPMTLIPAGTFEMGCDSTHNGGYSCSGDDFLHTVSLDAYLIDKYEVTNAQYAQCVTAGSCRAPVSNNSYTHSPYYGNAAYANHPVIWVEWNQASAYCAWAGKRLATEAEWEKAARGSSDTRAYPWGDTVPTCALANFWPSSACVGDTSAVGSYPSGASPYGVMDMAGNVWEWVNDWYGETYYSQSPESNPPGPSSGDTRVLRGGAWYNLEVNVRSAYRLRNNPDDTSSNIGFRCSRSP
jgi:formylglycine-generating enzyme required for sulfatase activity